MNNNTLAANFYTSRNHGIDALRILSMFMIVLLHVLGDGGIVNTTPPLSLKHEAGLFMEMAVYCAVDCYALISGYVGISAKYKYSNLCVLWLRVVYYSFGISLLFYLFVPNSMNIKGVFLTAFPTFTNKYWYFTAYFLLFLLIPILNSALRNMSKRFLSVTIITLVFFMSIIYPIVQKLLGGDVWLLSDGFSPMWLLILYLAGGYIRKYGLLKRLSSFWFLASYFVFSFLTWVSVLVIHIITKRVFGEIKFEYMWVNYFSITVLLAAISLLLVFERMKVSKLLSKLISFAAPLTFSVYLIHKHPLIQDYFIQNKFSWVANNSLLVMILLSLGIAVTVFLLCIAIDLIREWLFRLLRIKHRLNSVEEKIVLRI